MGDLRSSSTVFAESMMTPSSLPDEHNLVKLSAAALLLRFDQTLRKATTSQQLEELLDRPPEKKRDYGRTTRRKFSEVIDDNLSGWKFRRYFIQ